ncbi:MAG: hypothetical protein M3255_02965 [Pseudomonadota bacterium]|nr:hypothetical protein [Pseudomonadota bacterium]
MGLNQADLEAPLGQLVERVAAEMALEEESHHPLVPFKEGKPVSGPEDFLTGWMLDPEKREVWGRPVGLLQLADGSLLVSDGSSCSKYH